MKLHALAYVIMTGATLAATPGANPAKPLVPPPAGKTISTNPPPITNTPPIVTNAPPANMGKSQVITLPGGVTITVTATNNFTRAEMRRWLRDALAK